MAACAAVFLIWGGLARARRVEAISDLPGRAATLDARSPTGYARGERSLIVPERSEDSYDWTRRPSRCSPAASCASRHVDYENAPAGRVVSAPSPYRWWLGLLAWVGHAASGQPIGRCVEQAALYSDPLLFLAALVAATVFAARVFGGCSAAVVALGLVALFPLGSGYLPGMPDQRGLVDLLGLGGGLVLVGAVAVPDFHRRRRFAARPRSAGRPGPVVEPGCDCPPSCLARLPAGCSRRGCATARARCRSRGGSGRPAGWPRCFSPTWRSISRPHLGALNLEVVHPAYGVALVRLVRSSRSPRP